MTGLYSEQLDVKHPNMKPPRSKKTVGRSGGDETTVPFELWLNRGLHKIYDEVANEPIPDDLLKLIEDDRSSAEDDRPDQPD